MWPADAWKAAPVKSGSLVLIHGQVLKVAKQWSSAFAKVTALSTNIVFFCDKTRQWSNSGGIKRESSALSSSDVRLVQLIIVQVAHKSERNLSSSSRHAYTFHVIGQTVGYHQDGDDENLSYSFVFFTLTEMEGSFYASKNWLQVMKNCVKKNNIKTQNFYLIPLLPSFCTCSPLWVENCQNSTEKRRPVFRRRLNWNELLVFKRPHNWKEFLQTGTQ